MKKNNTGNNITLEASIKISLKLAKHLAGKQKQTWLHMKAASKTKVDEAATDGNGAKDQQHRAAALSEVCASVYLCVDTIVCVCVVRNHIRAVAVCVHDYLDYVLCARAVLRVGCAWA
jgi:hypothetical protein